MADTVTAKLYYTENGEEKMIERTYSAKKYFADFDANYAAHPELYTEKIVALVKSVADYGHYAQAYLDDVRTSWSVPEDHMEMDTFYTTYNEDDVEEAFTTSKGYKMVKDQHCTDIQKITFSLSLESETSIFVYLRTAATFNGTFNATLEGKPVMVEKESDTKYVVRIKNINAKDLSKMFELTVSTDNGTSTVRVSALSYVYTSLKANRDNSLAVNTNVAIYRYAMAADEALNH